MPTHPLVKIQRDLSKQLAKMSFAAPVEYVYDPTDYAKIPSEAYLKRFGEGPKEALFLGMNPGPFGMAQTGVPFGEIAHVRDFLGLSGKVKKPPREHPKRPIEGFDCARSEVSGRRLWGFFAERFGTADAFFERFFVYNYCPLVFMEESSRNRTPDKLPAAERGPLFEACDAALSRIVDALAPEMIIGVGAFAKKQAARALPSFDGRIESVLHPSPASPKANRGWAPQAAAELEALGVALPG